MFLYPCVLIYEFLLLHITLAAEQIFAHDGKYSLVPFHSVFSIHCGLKIAEPVQEQKPTPFSAEYWQRDGMETQLFVSGKSCSRKEGVLWFNHSYVPHSCSLTLTAAGRRRQSEE